MSSGSKKGGHQIGISDRVPRCFVVTGLVALVALSVDTGASAAGDRYRFADVTNGAGVSRGKFTDSWGSSWVDFDRSGYPDLFVGHHGGGPRLYGNKGDGSYRRLLYDFRRPPGYRAGDGDYYVDRHGCAWGEATGGGWPDLYCAIGANEGQALGPNQLLVFTEDGVKDVAGKYGVRDPYGRGRSVNWLDVDSDGDLDLFVSNFYRGSHPNAFFENKRGRLARTGAGLADPLRSYGSSWGDWDGDGDPDLVVTQWGAGSIAYENRRGRFVRVDLAYISGRELMSLAWNDFNGDGWIDVHVISQTRSTVLRNDHGRFKVADSRPLSEGRMSTWLDLENDGDLDSFVVQGAAGRYQSSVAINRPDFVLLRTKNGFARLRRASFRGPKGGNGDAVVAADHDRDGRVDLFVTNGYYEYAKWVGKHTLLENRSRARRWAAVDLAGGPWNPWGVGARVRVRTPKFTYWRFVTDGVAFRGQSEVGHVHLGLKRMESARVRVEWQAGGTDCVVVVAGTVTPVEKGSHPC